ncbi:hypothetical protein Tigna_01869 [Tepidimonas ignava]|uniref:FimV N-terminal domain-containing protein n=1 Tax=Tepidimonas ignava TaxID=114249 RepID=A0ABY3DGF4_9BURK|nr:FimV/HubP family polar landmark protein [Tepidimonas ignava]TSE20676.1 hypothetical protein Tigna_01869 [Tepidimonas ignava]
MLERHPPTTPPARGWRHVALAAALSLGVASNAWALALGRVSVQSPLGEPLRAEIDIPAITDAEAATLTLEIAGPERYRSTSLEWAPWLRDVQLELQRRPDGRTVVLVRSNRPITEPFLDLVVVARWAGGELLRGYTLLFDPPNLRPPAPVVPMVGAPPAGPEQPATAPAPAAAVAPATPPAPAGVRGAAAPPPQRPAVTADERRVKVRPGDTAGRLAQAHRPADVTLEQMLVAMLRANPQAFIRGNVHLLKAGAVLDMPDAEAARGVDAGEARRLVAAQTQDFDAYRRRLAAAAPAQRSDAPGQQAQGGVEAAVADTKPQANAADKLTLSKPGADDAAARVMAERQQAEQQQRAAELERNLRELEQLRQQAQATPPASADAPTTPPPAPQEGPVQAVLQHPWTLPGAGAVVVLLGALAALRWRQRRRQAATDDEGPAAAAVAATEPLAHEADTAAPADALDTDAPVDPVAEADVYLSYGRDAQAEDLLREALQADPQRLDARLKLLQILAQRRDTAGFEAEARALQPLADAATWAQVCEQGRALDPDNPLYGPGAGSGDASASAPAAEDELPTLDLALDTVDATAQAGDSALDVDVALDSTLGADNDAPAAAAPTAPPTDTEPSPQAATDDLGLDFDLDLAPAAAAPAETPPAPATLPPEVAELSLDLPVDESTEAAPLPELPAQAAPEPSSEEGVASAEPAIDQDPLETKLSLAREFEAIGDVDGARILAEEVLAEAQGALRERAQAFLAQLG